MMPLPPELEHLLRPYQVQPARQLFRALMFGEADYGYPGAVDLSDVGTGKSWMDLAAILATGKRVGVLCPPAGKDGWAATFQAFGVVPAFLESYEAMRSGFRPAVARRTPTGFEWRNPGNLAVIFDESQSMKNEASLTSFFGESVLPHKIPVICASATLAISPLELLLAGAVTGLHDGTAGGWRMFLEANGCRWIEAEERWAFRDRDERLLFNPTGSHLARLHSILIPQRGCRVRKADMGSQPGTTISLLPIETPDAQTIRDKWKDGMDVIKIIKDQGARPEVLKLKERALRISVLQDCEMSLVPPVAELIKREFEQDKSVVAFFTFVKSRVAMARLLNRYEGLYGGVTPKQRTRWVADFQANRLHYLGNHIGSGGASVSLHDIHGQRERSAFIFPTQSAVFSQQAPGRIDRQGGKSHSMQWMPVIPGTLAEWVMKRTAEKLQRMATLNDGCVDSIDLHRTISKPRHSY